MLNVENHYIHTMKMSKPSIQVLQMSGEDAIAGVASLPGDKLVWEIKRMIASSLKTDTGVSIVRYISNVLYDNGEQAHDYWPIGLEGNTVNVTFSSERQVYIGRQVVRQETR